MKEKNREKRQKFIQILVERVKHSSISLSSVSVSYYVTLSLFPILITIAAIIPYFNIDTETIIRYMDSLIPGPIVDMLAPIVRSVLTRSSVGLLSFGIIATLWSASKCMKYIQSGIDRAYGVENARLFITARIFSILIFIALVFSLILIMAVFSFGSPLIENFFEWLSDDFTFLRQFNVLKWTITTVALLAVFLLIYRITPSVKHTLKNAVPGAIFTTLCILIMVQTYAWFLGISTRSLTAYGILSAFFVLLIWLRLLAYVILIGAILNATILEYKNGPAEVRESRMDDAIRKFVDTILKKLKIGGKIKSETISPKDDDE